MFFGNLGKFKKFLTFTKYLKLTTRHNFITFFLNTSPKNSYLLLPVQAKAESKVVDYTAFP